MRMLAVMMLTGPVVAGLVAMAARFVFKDEPHRPAAVVMMMRNNGMEHDNCTCQRDHYYSH